MIRQTSGFKRDLKREAKGKHRRSLQTDFRKIVEILARDLQLPDSYRDHALAGDWNDHRDCHIKPDLVLIYRKPDPLIPSNSCDLVRTQSWVSARETGNRGP